MNLTVERFTSDHDTTLSLVRLDGAFVCFGLEDEYRRVKRAHETRIPAGEYQVTLRARGGFHRRYLDRFYGQHHGMLWVRDVPGFEYILIHVGNHDGNTSGCLLVGEGAHSADGDMRVTASVRAYLRLYSLVWHAADRGELTIAYRDLDRAQAPLLAA